MFNMFVYHVCHLNIAWLHLIIAEADGNVGHSSHKSQFKIENNGGTRLKVSGLQNQTNHVEIFQSGQSGEPTDKNSNVGQCRKAVMKMLQRFDASSLLKRGEGNFF